MVIVILFNVGKIKVFIESLDEGNYFFIISDVYDGMLYDVFEYLKFIINCFVEKSGVKELLLVKI